MISKRDAILWVGGVFTLSVIIAASAEMTWGSIERHDSGEIPPARKNLVLDVRLNFSPGHLLLIDPKGRRTGFGPADNHVQREIPTSQYTLSSDMDPEADMDAITGIYVRSPLEGTYRLTVVGTDLGVYLLEVFAYSSDPTEAMRKAVSVERFREVNIAKGSIHTYEFTFGNRTGCQHFMGGFYGGGSQINETDKFLTYANLSESQTTLRQGVTSFPLHLFYGSAITPNTFKAELNGADISSSFHPVPGTNQITVLNLAPGSNVLVLSISGSLPSRMATDIDRIVYSVQ